MTNSQPSPHGMDRLAAYLILPKEISEFEARYLQRMNRIGLLFFALHVPFITALAWANSTGPLLALALTLAVTFGPALAYRGLSNPRDVSVIYGVAAMFMGGVLVHFGQGPVQIEMHFYFFALLAMLAVFGNPMVIVAAAVTVALHHLALWYMLPRSVFNYDAPLWVVAVHAAFVVLEAIAGCFIARSFFDNVIGLEKIVQSRTEELARRSRETRLVLDNILEGVLTIDRSGMPSAERSRTFDQWFGSDVPAQASIFDLFEQRSKDFADRSRFAWGEVVDGIMPLALTLDQMPTNLKFGASFHSVAYRPIGDGEHPERFLVVISDVTAEVGRERAEREQREAMTLFERLLADRNSVSALFDEGSAIVDALTTGGNRDLTAIKRMLHTLKGNSAIFGLQSVADLCHELEDRVAETDEAPLASDLARLRDRWNVLSTNVDRLLGGRRDVVEVDVSDHDALEQSVRRGATGATLLRQVHALRLEPTARRLEHFGEQVRRIATRLDKSVRVEVEDHGMRIDPRHWGGFWSAFIHAVRNAADHGVETPHERASRGKTPVGTVALRTFVRDDRFVVEVADDGGGIDWARVAQKASELGLPAVTEGDLRAALFRDGVSTAAHVTDISGRGVGMGAVRAATADLGGELEIETTLSRGTTLRMVFPKNAMSPGLTTAVHEATHAA